jgi:hypothetical protein
VTVADLTRMIVVLLVALCAPADAMRHVRGFTRAQLWLFARGLAQAWKQGEKLRYPGEDLATVARRIDLHAWLARDPRAAMRHMARRRRGHLRARHGDVLAPVVVSRMCGPALRQAGAGVPVAADTS